MNTNRFKFRVWDKDYRRYHKNVELYHETGEFYPDIENCYCFGDFLKQPARFIVEQCTGLKDKNGKLVYEGDIVKTAIGEIGVVVFFDAQFAVRFENAFYCSVAEAKEIIGNIHENGKRGGR